jgi:hypothetical protein
MGDGAALAALAAQAGSRYSEVLIEPARLGSCPARRTRGAVADRSMRERGR